MAILTGWLPIYLGTTFVLLNKRLKDITIYTFLQLALGVMLSHFVITFSIIPHIYNYQISTPSYSITFLGGFLIGTGILMAYSGLKESLIEGPKDSRMMEEFEHKFFFLDPDMIKRRRFSIYSLRYDLAICYGLHGIGAGLMFSQIIKSPVESYIILLPFLVHKIVEGLSVAAPVARSPYKLSNILLPGAIAGIPFVSGVSIGGLNINPSISMFLFSFSLGALFYCLIMLTEMVYMTQRSDISPFSTVLKIIIFFSLSYLLHQLIFDFEQDGLF